VVGAHRARQHGWVTSPCCLVDDMFTLHDSRRVRIRSVRDDDGDRLVAFHEGLSERTVRRRFLAGLPHLSATQARTFAHVDGVKRVALVAEDAAGALVAVARFDCLSDEAGAEIAVVVADDYQRQGLGTELVERLVTLARAHGVDHFAAEVLVENRPMLATFRDAGLEFTSERDCGVLSLDLPLQIGLRPPAP
jgi:GNAT superfamily N-acetyltransferase